MTDDDERKYAKGGIISGTAVNLSIRRLGVCANGHCLYQIESGLPEHIISAAEIKAHDYSQVNCQETIADD